MPPEFVTRFAPSPTGPLHLGHAYSAMLAHDMARAAGGRFLLRIEDIDGARCRPEWEAQIYDDLAWLGVMWDAEPMRQSDRRAAYEKALNAMWLQGLVYPCTCTRHDIRLALSAPQEGVPLGPDRLIYPGTCRWHRRDGKLRSDAALRLDIAAVFDRQLALEFTETGFEQGLHRVTLPEFQSQIGDVVLSRRDMGTSYHLAVVVDDAAQGITDVVRGEDLFAATKIHRLLQALLGLPTPIYHHHRLIRDEAGKRLAKRDDARALSKYRSEGATPSDIRVLVGL